jgi:hypothetical protein
MGKPNHPWAIQILTPDYVVAGNIVPGDDMDIILNGDYEYYKDRCILTFTDVQMRSVNNPAGSVINASELLIKQRSGLLALIPRDDAGLQAFQKASGNKDYSLRIVMYSGVYIIRASINPGGLYASGACFMHTKDAKIEYQSQNANLKPIDAQWLVINTEMIQGYSPE